MSKNVSIVVNQAPNAAEGEKTYKTILRACENFLRLKPPMAGMIRHDPRVKDTIRNQTPLLTRSPNTEAAEDVEKIAKVVIRDLEEARRTALEA
jgi:flagellar biosynthesis protein FlhG